MQTLECLQVDVSDSDLVNAARAGDRSAFGALMARDRDLVYVYAYARLRNREEAEDVAQETFIRAYMSLGRLRGSAAWHAWLMQIARNACNDSLRRQRVRQSESLDATLPDGHPSPEMQILTDERHRELRDAVDALPEEYRLLLRMRFGFGCTRREIAAALHVPESTIMGRIARAMRLLRRHIGDEY
jgi:RNA polymerase sigma-70 factor, ECF subfamily